MEQDLDSTRPGSITKKDQETPRLVNSNSAPLQGNIPWDMTLHQPFEARALHYGLQDTPIQRLPDGRHGGPGLNPRGVVPCLCPISEEPTGTKPFPGCFRSKLYTQGTSERRGTKGGRDEPLPRATHPRSLTSSLRPPWQNKLVIGRSSINRVVLLCDYVKATACSTGFSWYMNRNHELR